MPPKGWTKEIPTRCPNCSKLLPEAMLRGFVQQLRRLHTDLGVDDVPRDDEVALRRAAQLSVLHARSTAEILISDAEHLLCEGHERKKRVAEPADPSDPDPERTTVRRNKKAPLRAVTDESAD